MPGPVNLSLVTNQAIGTGPTSVGSLMQGPGYRVFANVAALPDKGRFVGEVVTVKNDGDGKDALYSWRLDQQWSKIADPDNVVLTITYPTMHDLSAQADGVETSFTLPASAVAGTLLVTVCGLILAPGTAGNGKDYEHPDSTTVDFHQAPPSGVNVLAYYVEA